MTTTSIYGELNADPESNKFNARLKDFVNLL